MTQLQITITPGLHGLIARTNDLDLDVVADAIRSSIFNARSMRGRHIGYVTVENGKVAGELDIRCTADLSNSELWRVLGTLQREITHDAFSVEFFLRERGIQASVFGYIPIAIAA